MSGKNIRHLAKISSLFPNEVSLDKVIKSNVFTFDGKHLIVSESDNKIRSLIIEVPQTLDTKMYLEKLNA